MSEINEANLQNVLKDLRTSSETLLEWKWDSRFNTALAEFVAEKTEDVKEILDKIFTEVWETTNIIGAPDNVKTIDYLFGSLMYGQQLLTTDPKQNLILYCIWWPWGNGETVSIRIGHYNADQPELENEEATKKFQEWFGL